MARFFQTQPIELSRDNIYMPPMELLMASLDKADEDFTNNVVTPLNLFRDIELQYLDHHKDAAANIKSGIDKQVTDLAEQARKNPTDPNLIGSINKMKSDLQKRFTNGDVYNIQQSFANDAKFREELAARDDIGDAEKQDHLNTYWNDYKNKYSPTGEATQVYKPGDIIGDKNYINEITKYVKDLPEAKWKEQIERRGYQYNTTTGNETVKKLITPQLIQDYMESRPDLTSHLQLQANSPVYSNRGIVVKPDGSIDYEKGFGKNLVDAALPYQINDRVKTVSLGADNADYLSDKNFQQQMASAQAQANLTAIEGFTNKNVGAAFKYSYNTMTDYREAITPLVKSVFPHSPGLQAQVKQGKYNLADLIEILNENKNKAKNSGQSEAVLKTYDDKVAQINKFVNQYSPSMSASYSELQKGGQVDAKTQETIFKNHNTAIGKNFGSLKLTFPDVEINDPKEEKLNSSKFKTGRQGLVVNSARGQKITLPNGKNVTIEDMKYIDKSNVMDFRDNTRFDNLDDINNNETHIMVRLIYGKNPEDYIDRPAFFNNSQMGSTGITLN